MGNCLSSNPHADAGAQAGLVKAAPDQVITAGDIPAPIKPAAAKEPPSEVIDLDSVVANVVSNPDTDLILNMIDPVNGPAAGLPYQVHYLGPPRPPCEKERLATVHALGKISDAAKPDPEIATILKLVAGVFKCPAALCALFDEKQVFISEQEGNVIPCGEFPWRWTLCGWSMAFKNPQVLVIQDTLEDARFANNLKVTKAPHVRFYCGAPLVASNGQRLGTLCFADVKPRKFDQASCVMMNNLSELVVRQLEKDIALKLKEKDNKALKETYKNLQRAVDCYEHSVVLLDTSEKGWKVVYANASWTKQTGLPREKLIGSLLCDVLEATDGTQLPSLEMHEACKRAKDTKVKMARIKDPSVTKTVSLSFKPAGRHLIDDTTIPIGVPGFLDLDDKEEDVAHRFYFMTVHLPGQRRGSQVSSCYLSPCGMSPSLSGSISSDGTERSVVAGLELAHLLGRGSFGWVYYATWYGTPVAVKVIDEDVRRPVDTDGARDPQDGPHQEAVMAHELRHPNIVATLKYATHSIPRGRAPALCDYLNTNQELALMDTHNSSFSKGTTPPRTASTPARSKEPSAPEVVPANGDARWAVIEAPPDSQWEVESNGSEDEKADARVLKALQVKADGWMMEEHSAGNKFARPSLDHPSSVLASSAANNTAASSMLMQTWMVMEYCDKGCVQDAVDRGWLRDMWDCLASKANMVAVIATAHEIASAMQYLHAHDIVHGDLSGWNVMLSSTGSTSAVGGRGWTAKVADFGMSRSMDMQTRITTRNYGTITHMPPELLVAGTMSKAVDVWSFGVLLWQMYTGSRPWSGLTHAQIILKVAQQKQRLHWDDNTPAAYRDLAESCMAFDMDKRPTFAAIVQTLDEMKQNAGY